MTTTDNSMSTNDNYIHIANEAITAAIKAAETVICLLPEGEDRPRQAVELVRRWASGECVGPAKLRAAGMASYYAKDQDAVVSHVAVAAYATAHAAAAVAAYAAAHAAAVASGAYAPAMASACDSETSLFARIAADHANRAAQAAALAS